MFVCQAEDGIRDLVRSRGLGDVYKRQAQDCAKNSPQRSVPIIGVRVRRVNADILANQLCACLLYTSDAADERSSVDLGGRRIIKKKTNVDSHMSLFDKSEKSM